MNEYLKIFIDSDYPKFIDKYLNTKTLNRIKYIGQFCGCDYTKLYNPRFFYSRLDHSLITAHMAWHFTHNKKMTIASLLHDIGTPAFAHCIDYLLKDYENQESSEKDIIEMIKQDEELLNYLEEDNILLEDLKDLEKYSIIENKSPKLCTDRLDGVLHTNYIWLKTAERKEIQEIYQDLIVLKNEEGKDELGFQTKEIAEKFVKMVHTYAIELQSNTDKFVMEYIARTLNILCDKKSITLEDLYEKKESDIIKLLSENIKSWKDFQNATKIISTKNQPDQFYISVNVKKRNVIPLVKIENNNKRISEISEFAKKLYQNYENYKDLKYAYIEEIKELDSKKEKKIAEG